MGIDKKKLSIIEYVNRENSFVHPTLSEDRLPYIYLREGNECAVDEAVKNFKPDIQGRISDDELRNIKYLFVAATTLACRYSIEGGVDQKKAFAASDTFIRQMDLLDSVDKVIKLHEDMIRYYLLQVSNAKIRLKNTFHISKCLEYIYDHMNENILVTDVAEFVKLHPNYLSSLFKKETGVMLNEFICMEKVNTAGNMLLYTEYSLSEISSTLSFSSQSYFTRVFKKYKGVTPKEFRSRGIMQNENNKEIQ